VPSLAVEVPEPVPDASAPEWLGIDRVLLMGTEIGIKGLNVDPGVYDSIRQAVAARDTLLHRPTVFVDGGIGTTRFRTWLQRVRTGCLEASCLPSTTRRRHRLAARAARRNATRGTAAYLRAHGIETDVVFKINEGRPHVGDSILNGEIALIVNTPLGRESFFDDRTVRRIAMMHGVPCITTLTGGSAAVAAIRALGQEALDVRSLQDYHAGSATARA